MRNVAVVLHGLGANGIDTLFANLAKYWDYNNFNITYFLAVDENVEQFWEKEIYATGVRIIHLHDLDRGRLIKWPITLFKALKQYGPFDVIHVNMDLLNGINLATAKMAGIPIRICHSHNSSSSNAQSRLKQVYINLMRFFIHKYGTIFLACSDMAGKHFFPKEKYSIVYNGIDIARYLQNGSSIKAARDNTFVTVGRFSQQKNPFFLLDIFQAILLQLPDARLNWVGNGFLFSDVKNKAEEYGIADKINYCGVRSDVEEILKQSSYFLFPSLFEGFGLALVEAQAAGLDCFASDTVPQIADCGKCKFISLQKSASDWADEIVSYIRSGETMALNKELLSQFDIAQMATNLELYYKS